MAAAIITAAKEEVRRGSVKSQTSEYDKYIARVMAAGL